MKQEKKKLSKIIVLVTKTKVNCMKLFLINILLCYANYSVSQQMDTIKVQCTYDLTIFIPNNYKDTTINYEEGFSRTFFWENLDILDIQCSSLSEPTFINDTSHFIILKTCETKETKILTGMVKATSKIWGVLWFKNIRVIVSYNVEAERKKLFDKIFEDITVHY